MLKRKVTDVVQMDLSRKMRARVDMYLRLYGGRDPDHRPPFRLFPKEHQQLADWVKKKHDLHITECHLAGSAIDRYKQ